MLAKTGALYLHWVGPVYIVLAMGTALYFSSQGAGRVLGPVIAATDYVRAVPETVRAFVPEGRRYITLGTDGFGRSDTRAALRQFFGVDAQAVAKAARFALGL